MQTIFKKTAFSLLCLLIASGLFAQGVPDTSVLSRKLPPSTKLQHSIAFSNFIGLQYDLRFRTPNKLTDFYVAAEGIPAGNYQHLSLQGGVLFGNFGGFSLGGGMAMLLATDDVTNSDNEAYKKPNLIVGLPFGVRFQPAYRSFFAQVNYVPMLNLTDGKTAAYPQIQLGFSFGGKNPYRDTFPIPQGIQHSAYLQIADFGWGLAYDARFRTHIKWLDWAANASVGGYPITNRVQSSIGTTLGASALFGKRSFSCEVGVQGAAVHYERQGLSYIDYKTGDILYSDIISETYTIEALLGLRYQQPRGGVSAFANLGYGPAYYSDYPSFQNYNATIRVGVGYSLKTK